MGAVAVKRIEVGLGEKSYAVHVGAGLLAEAGGHLAPMGRLFVVSDTNVWAALGERLSESAAMATEPILVAPGEASKSWPVLTDLVERLIALGIERGDTVVAFGGGMVGDLAGFAAAIVKRGVRCAQIPTSLLAQVDSSVGGKTGINLKAGKNLAGAFHQPAIVLIDPECLDTLPERELRAGYAEVVKYGLIGDPDFFAWCEANGERLLKGDVAVRIHAIEASVRAKAAIVAGDERETKGRRALLNFGHTFAHALEVESGYSGALLHGEAVATGMALAFRFSAARGLCTIRDAERAAAHLRGAKLPVTLAAAGIDADGRSLVGHMAHDKKRADGRLPFILARGIGDAFVESSVGLAEVEAFLDRERCQQ